MFGRNLLETGREKDDLTSEDRQLSFWSIPRLGAARESYYANNVTSPKRLMLCFERYVPSCRLRLAHHLNLDTLGPNIVKDQLGPRRSFGVDTARHANLSLLLQLACFEGFIFAEEISEVDVDLELVGIRIGIERLFQFLDTGASDLEILLVGC